MAAFRMSEKEIMTEFSFVAAKVRAYRFERQMPLFPISKPADCKPYLADLLHTIERLNLNKEPSIKVRSYSFDPTSDRMSDGELALMEFRMRGRQ